MKRLYTRVTTVTDSGDVVHATTLTACGPTWERAVRDTAARLHVVAFAMHDVSEQAEEAPRVRD